jgi:hypothetical protein
MAKATRIPGSFFRSRVLVISNAFTRKHRDNDMMTHLAVAVAVLYYGTPDC